MRELLRNYEYIFQKYSKLQNRPNAASFISCRSYAEVMNLIIGVIVEKIMSSAKEQDKEQALRPSEEDFAKLQAIFNRMDEDGSGKINSTELVRVASDATIRDELRRLQIYAGTDAGLLMKLWDQDSSGSLDLKEFVDGAMRIRKSEHTQQLLLLQHDLHSYSRTLLTEMRSIAMFFLHV